MLMTLALAGAGLAPLGAATPLPRGTAPAGVYATLANDDAIRECAHSARQSVAAFVRWLSVGTVRVPNVGLMYTASGTGSCLNGEHNTLVVGLMSSDGKTYRQVLRDSIYGDLKVRADGSIVTLANDGASVSLRTTYAYDGNVYRAAQVERVFLDTGEAKPLAMPIHFAPGSSSVTVKGKVYLAFGDDYTLDAAAGQTMSIDLRPTSGSVAPPELYFDAPGKMESVAISSLKWRGTLPATGTYHLSIIGAFSDKLRDSGFDRPSTYTMTIAIH
jgi:hypothetical protein